MERRFAMVRRTERSGIRSTGPTRSNWGRTGASGGAGGFLLFSLGGRLFGLGPPGAFGERAHVLRGDPATWTARLYLADIYTKLARQAAGGRRSGNRTFEGSCRGLFRLNFSAYFLCFCGGRVRASLRAFSAAALLPPLRFHPPSGKP